jgi:hypothetical protein
MRKDLSCHRKITTNILAVPVALCLLVLSGCSPDKANGTYLIVELENSENVSRYSVFNPYVRSIEECNSNAKAAITQILTSVPRVVPEDSKVKSWRCSLTPPESGG